MDTTEQLAATLPKGVTCHSATTTITTRHNASQPSFLDAPAPGRRVDHTADFALDLPANILVREFNDGQSEFLPTEATICWLHGVATWARLSGFAPHMRSRTFPLRNAYRHLAPAGLGPLTDPEAAVLALIRDTAAACETAVLAAGLFQ